MVKLSAIKQSNAQFAKTHHESLVCVFAGATSGIGAGTLEAMARILHGGTFYVIGRSETRFADQRAKLEQINPDCTIIFVQAELSLLSSVDAACKQIAAAEKRVDCLFMSQGFFPLIGPQYTKEGIDLAMMLSYYSRMRLIHNLLPLLSQSPHPRISSVLSAGKESPINLTDLGLEQQWTTLGVMKHTVTMMSLAFSHLAAESPKTVLIHSAPGIVSTDIFAKLKPLESTGVLWRFLLVLTRGLAAVMMLLVGMSPDDCGQRQAYYLTNETFAPGAYRLSPSSDVFDGSSVLDGYREQGWPEKVWDHTLGVFEKVLSSST